MKWLGLQRLTYLSLGCQNRENARAQRYIGFRKEKEKEKGNEICVTSKQTNKQNKRKTNKQNRVQKARSNMLSWLLLPSLALFFLFSLILTVYRRIIMIIVMVIPKSSLQNRSRWDETTKTSCVDEAYPKSRHKWMTSNRECRETVMFSTFLLLLLLLLSALVLFCFASFDIP